MSRTSHPVARATIPSLVAALILAGCGGGSADRSDAEALDVSDIADGSDAAEPDTAGPDAEDTDVDGADADAVEPPGGDATHRAIGGMSMGATALTIALRNPGTFDMVGALGGYADTTYMMAHMLRLQLAGFCPLEALEGRGDALNDPDADPPVDCGPAAPRFPLEQAMSYNRLHYDTNGITMTRGFYGDIIGNFASAYGNLVAPAHPESPLFPAGVDLDWVRATSGPERCADLRPIAAEYAFNAEYNPEGLYPVIPLCDQEEPADPELLPSWFDPAAPRHRPIEPLLAVDLNGNGRRDLGEPLLLNPWERFDDVGLDGCANAYEDGEGGCLDAPRDLAEGVDPNGDDFHWRDHPDGLEANGAYDEGEPFSDLGLDGVGQAVAGFADRGEGNGRWDAVAALDTLAANDADTLVRALDAEALDGMDFWLDAGIRDALHAAVGTRHIVAALTSRGRDVTVYRGFAEREGTLLPEATVDGFMGTLFTADLSIEAVGRDVYVEYGDPDASEEAIEAGDGKHVGRSADALNRLAAFVLAALWRFPEPDLVPNEPLHAPVNSHFYSEALGARRGYSLGVPPGYRNEDNAERRYPTLYFMHGLGQDGFDLAPAAGVLGLLMSDGVIPKAILVFPDGGCCFEDVETGARECACGRGEDGVRACVDPGCRGPAETCEVREIPSDRLRRECHQGSLYADMRTNRRGEPRDDLGYQSSVMELVRHVDAAYRTRSPVPD